MLPIKLAKTHELRGWQAQLADAITSPDELLQMLELEHLVEAHLLQPDFRLRVPRTYVAKMQPGYADDPLLKQVLPVLEENTGIVEAVHRTIGDVPVFVEPQ